MRESAGISAAMDDKQIEDLIKDWLPRIKLLINKVGFGARDKELLTNELMEKVWKCTPQFDPARQVKFETYLNRCLVNHIQVFIRCEQRKKHSFLTGHPSLNDEAPGYTRNPSLNEELPRCAHGPSIDSSTALTYGDVVADKKSKSVDQTVFELQIEEVKNLLPDICRDILTMVMSGYSFTEIAESLHEERIVIREMWRQVIAPLIEEEFNLDLLYDDTSGDIECRKTLRLESLREQKPKN